MQMLYNKTILFHFYFGFVAVLWAALGELTFSSMVSSSVMRCIMQVSRMSFWCECLFVHNYVYVIGLTYCNKMLLKSLSKPGLYYSPHRTSSDNKCDIPLL